jgi:hypothetical protein
MPEQSVNDAVSQRTHHAVQPAPLQRLHLVRRRLVWTVRKVYQFNDDDLIIGVEHKPVVLEQQSLIDANGREHEMRETWVGEG